MAMVDARPVAFLVVRRVVFGLTGAGCPKPRATNSRWAARASAAVPVVPLPVVTVVATADIALA